MSKVADRVKEILSRNLSARNSDKYLLLDYLQEQGVNFTPEQTEIFLSVNFESITRVRRKLQEEGKYLADPEIEKQRKLKASMTRYVAPIATTNNLADVLEMQPNELILEEL